MPDSLNTQIADALTERQIQVARVETDERREVWAILALLEADLLATLKASDPTELRVLARRRRRVHELVEEELAPLIRARYATIANTTAVALVQLAQQEATAVARLVNTLAGDEVLTEPVPGRTALAIVNNTLIPTATTPTDLSATANEWWQRLSTGLQQRLGDQLMVSVSLGESLTEAVARVRGTADKGFTDGLMEKARQDAARLLRTEVTNAGSEARVAVAEVNAESLNAIEHVSILDGHTTYVCQSRHGLRFTADTHVSIGHGIPYLSGIPYHWG